MAARYWSCRKCGYRNERAHLICRGGIETIALAKAVGHIVTSEPCTGRRPKRPVGAHQKMLRDHPYADYLEIAATIHGVTDESCCACGKPRAQERRHDRDHDHRSARMRGLLCPGDTGCNKLLLPWINTRVAWAIANAKAVDDDRTEYDRWVLLAAYLERVDAHYVREAEQDATD